MPLKLKILQLCFKTANYYNVTNAYILYESRVLLYRLATVLDPHLTSKVSSKVSSVMCSILS